jgi:hypothetical protein
MKLHEQPGSTRPYHSAMIYVSKGVRAGLVIAVISVLGWLGGCSDVPTFVPAPPPPPPASPPSTIAIVSDTARAAGFASGPVEASVQRASAADEVVYVSLTPGTVPAGATATIRRVGGAASLVTTLSDGGFDPVPVQAQTNDSIEVAVRDAGGATIGVLRLTVTARRPPIVVRTNPPHKKNDVPLNAAIIVVFSEPMDGGTVTPTSVQLLQGTTPVAGTVRLVDASQLVAAFEPSQLLTPGTDYRLVVTQAVRDLDGERLEAGVATDFRTGNSLTGRVASVSMFPYSVAGLFPLAGPISVWVGDATGNMLLAPVVEWASSDTNVANVWPSSSRSAWVTMRTTGVATITATSEGVSGTVVFRSNSRSGRIRVTTVTTGEDLDPTYYMTDDPWSGGGIPQLPANGSVILPIAFPAGDRVLSLLDVASNCAVVGGDAQTVTVRAGDTSEVAFAVTCAGNLPGLRGTITTTGTDVDPDGYWLEVVDHSPCASVPLNGSFACASMTPGTYEVQLNGVAANCTVMGANRQTVTVARGATADVAFAVMCGSTPSLRVTIATTGVALPTGYRVNVAGFGWQNAPVNGSVAFYSIPSGEYSVELNDIASNCVVSGASPRAVTVSEGATAELSFAVTCSSATVGSIRVTTRTTGDDIDPNGYYVNDPTDPWDYGILLPANGSVLIDGVLPGDTRLSIWHVASNCAVVGPDDQTVTVKAGATSEVIVAVTCAGNLPSIRVTIATTGTDIDPDGYVLLFQGADIGCGGTVPLGCDGPVPVNGVYTLSGLNPFEPYEVVLAGVAPNCAVSDDNDRYVTVTKGATVDVMFTITCSSSAVTGSIRVTMETTGEYIPNWEFLQVEFQGSHYQLGPNGSYLFTAVPTGDYPIRVNVLVAANCAVSPPNPHTVTVAADTTVDVVFPVTCRS